MFSCWVKPFIVKQLVLNHNDTRNYTNDPDQKFTYYGDFGLIMSTQVDTNGFEWLLKVTILTCDLFVFCTRTLITSSEFLDSLQTLAFFIKCCTDSESWGKQKNCQRICWKSNMNFIKKERDIKRYPRN